MSDFKVALSMTRQRRSLVESDMAASTESNLMPNYDAPIPERTPRKRSIPLVAAQAAVLIAVVLGVALPASAMSLKSIMAQMVDTTKRAKRLLAGPFDLAAAQAILENYAQQGGAGGALYTGRSDAKSQDLQGRFAQLATVAAAGRRSVTNQASFRATFVAVAEGCRSCHAIYK